MLQADTKLCKIIQDISDYQPHIYREIRLVRIYNHGTSSIN